MFYSYDYEELLIDLKEELLEGSLTKNSYIQILRDKEAIFKDYYPIIDYYYDEDTMKDILTIDFDDDKGEKEYIIKQKEMYLKDKPYLELKLVSDVIDEMEELMGITDDIL